MRCFFFYLKQPCPQRLRNLEHLLKLRHQVIHPCAAEGVVRPITLAAILAPAQWHRRLGVRVEHDIVKSPEREKKYESVSYMRERGKVAKWQHGVRTQLSVPVMSMPDAEYTRPPQREEKTCGEQCGSVKTQMTPSGHNHPRCGTLHACGRTPLPNAHKKVVKM